MLLKTLPCALLLSVAACSAVQLDSNKVPETAAAPRVTASFDADWRFTTGDPVNAQNPSFTDAAWRRVDLPHDWSIEGPYAQDTITLRGGGYLPSGIGWYRKTFTLPAEAKSKRVFIDFDGVMANSEVFLNGKSVGKRPYGYISFQYDLTPLVHFDGQPNVLAVRCDNTQQPASRWYAGAGIYRHTRLNLEEPMHLEHWSTHITTPDVKGEQAVVRVETSAVNQSDMAMRASVEMLLVDADEQVLAKAELPVQEAAAGKSVKFERELVVNRPALWDVNSPVMYKVVVRLKSSADDEAKVVDTETVPFGIRLTEWKPDTGFWLNGENVKLKGVCLHHDGGAVGAAVPLSIWERRLADLKELGVNAIRTAHNPPAPEFLDLCDRMGFLVMEESFDTWTAAKPNGQQGYNRLFNDWFKADTRDMVLRDRNHPSIVIWSCGNEIRDNLSTQAGRERFLAQRDIYHELDGPWIPSGGGGRPVTFALFRPTMDGVYAAGGLADDMDVVGQNYNEAGLIAAHNVKPSRIVIGTENQHGLAVWRVLRDTPFMSGQFLWTGVDYLGEADWPYISRYSGLLDRTGMPHARAFERAAWWSGKPMVAIIRQEGTNPPMGATAAAPNLVHDWTPANPTTQAVTLTVHSNCDEVELLLNGKSLGSKPRNADDSARTWQAVFEPGTIKAIGKNKGEVAAADELRTAGKPVAVVAAADRAAIVPSFDDVSIVSVTVKDAGGAENPRASDLVTFAISGPGQIIAVDNGDAASHESYQGSQRHLFNGRAIAIVRANGTGPITVTASVEGLTPASTKIEGVQKR